jgi:hypothetical protein
MKIISIHFNYILTPGFTDAAGLSMSWVRVSLGYWIRVGSESLADSGPSRARVLVRFEPKSGSGQSQSWVRVSLEFESGSGTCQSWIRVRLCLSQVRFQAGLKSAESGSGQRQALVLVGLGS